jgi:hypothetical protein
MVFLAPNDYGQTVVAEARSLWGPSQHTWLGWDGSEWDLSHGLSGLALQTGTRGMQMPPIIRYSSKAPAVAGSFWRGSVTDEREVFWPIRVFADGGSREWIAHNNRFWKTLDPDQTGLWVVTQEGTEDEPSTKRSLRVRYTGLADDSDDVDPGMYGWQVYGVNLIAEEPFWMGETATRSFQPPPTDENYFGGSGGGGFGPPFFISTGSSTDSADITNEGDVPAWPIWTVRGPLTTVTVGLDGHAITFPITLADGEWVTINTAPTDQVALDQVGADRSSQLTAVDFAAIPKGANVPLTITMTGTGSVDCTIQPRFYRAK